MKTRLTLSLTIGCAILGWAMACSNRSHAYPPAAEQGPPPPAVTDRTRLTLSRIYRGDEFNLESTSLKWDDVDDVLLRKQSTAEGDDQDQDQDSSFQIIRRPVDQSDPPNQNILSIPADPIGSVDRFDFSDDGRWLMVKTRSQRVWRHFSLAQYWLFDLQAKSWQAVAGGQPIMNATFSPKSESVAYVRDGDLMIEEVATGLERAIASSEQADLIHGTFDWVYEEELGLRQGFQFNGDGTRIAFWQTDQSGVPIQTLIDNTAQRYPTLKQFAYPKVGQTNSAVRIGVHELATERTVWMDIDGDPRENYLAAMQWIEPPGDEASGERLMIQQLNRRQSRNRLWIADPQTGSAHIVHTETSPGWIMHQEELHRIPSLTAGPSTIDYVWQSEQTGWNQLYRLSLNESLTEAMLTPITNGQWDVIEIDDVDSETGRIYLTASPNNPTTRGLYVVDANAREPQISRISPETGGTYRYEISPTGRYAIETWSDFQTPPVKRLVELIEYEVIETIDNNESVQEALQELKPVRHEFVRLAIDDDVALDAWVMLPAEVEGGIGIDGASQTSIPLLVYVYGEPAGQTVRDVYGGKGYLWNRLMVQNGIAVASIDNRGTASPRGRAFRQAVYGKIGILPPADQAAGVRRLLARYPILDPARVGVWGWSGGGSSSLHALFRYPELFKTAVAVAPVSDQLDYDTIYQERYMGLIEDGREKFIEGSPITHAKHLEGSLLIIHGTGDDNVHYASTQRLINELIAQGKSFEMMAYPGRSHSISEGSGTVMHIRRMITNFLLRTLVPK